MGGVRYYTLATLEIPFPEDQIYCWNCPLLHRGRQMCMASGETIEDVRKTGQYCGLKFEVNENGEVQTTVCGRH